MSVYPGPLSTQLWSPWNLPQGVVKAWWNADDHGTSKMIDDGGGLISSWTDRIGGRAATGTAAQRPVWTSNAVNGRAGLTGDGANTVLNTANVTGIPAAIELWAVAFINPAVTAPGIIVRVGNGGKHIGKTTSSGVFNIPYANDGNTSLFATDFSWKDGLVHIIGGSFFGTTELGRWDGRDFSPNATSTIASVTTPSTRISLFSNATGVAGLVWPGAIRQILITSAPLTTLQRQQLEGWLAWDGWSGPSDPLWPLPKAHPYYRAAPRIGTGIPFKKPLTKAPAWSPRNLGNSLAAWWNADDPASGAVATWTDRVGGLATTATAGIQPIQAANGWAQNGKAGVTADGVDDCLVATSIAALPLGAVAGEIWASATNARILDTNFRVIARYGGVAGGATIRSIGNSNVNPNRLWVSDGSTNLIATSGPLFNAAGHIVGGYWSGTSEGGRIDGQDSVPATTTIASLNTTPAARLRIFASNATTASGFWGGTLRHLFILTLLTLAQRQQLEGWLAWDGWNRSDPLWPLPSTHPYYNAAP